MNISTHIPILTHFEPNYRKEMPNPFTSLCVPLLFFDVFFIGLKGIVSYVDFDPSILCRTGMV